MMLHVQNDERNRVDVAIVGAGPAGAACACHFARAGYRVALIDQRRFPRDKVCGDFVGPAALAELDRLHSFSQQIFTNATKIRNGAVYINGHKVVRRPFPHIGDLRDYGLCIPRMLLDEAIVHAAVASGAHVTEEAHVKGYETDETGVKVFYQQGDSEKCLRTRLLIGADGSSSLISRIVRGEKPPRRDRIVAVRAYFEGVEGQTDQAGLYVNLSSFPGYSWLFPTGTDTANVGVGMPLEACTGNKQQLGQLLTQLIASDPAIRCRLAKAKIRGRIVGWPLATFNPRLAVIANRVALIGDAAGLINPLSGEGIQYALRSARWCSEELSDALSSDSLSVPGLRRYATRIQKEMRYDMALSRFIIDLVTNPMLNPLWFSALAAIGKGAASDSGYFDLAAGLFAGIVPAREFFSWRMARFTVITLGIVLGMLHRPLGLESRIAADAKSVISMFKDSLRHPVTTIKWSRDCAFSALELAGQMAISGK